jgi:predicted transposase YbfD/YdcC
MKLIEEQEVRGIVAHFAELPDPRCPINRKHLLVDLIVICVCAVLAGADGPDAIAKWARAQDAWLRRFLRLPHSTPSHDTINRVLEALQPQAFQACFANWLQSLRNDDENDAGNGSAPSVRPHVAIDGKCLRRSHDRRRGLGPLHLVSAWATDYGISLGQLATDEKSNEITAIPQLIEQLELDRAIVTIDAAGCQKEIARKIIDGGGDYILALKGNHEKLYQATLELFDQYHECDFAGVPVSRHEEEEISHGRREQRIYLQVPAPDTLPGFADWKRLKTLGMVTRIVQIDGREMFDSRYYLCSLRRSIQPFARAVRGHWGIENTLHWSLDMTFREDDSRVRGRRVADNLGWLRRMALSLLKQHPGKESLVMKRRLCGWSIKFLTEVLTSSRS